jgi:integrase
MNGEVRQMLSSNYKEELEGGKVLIYLRNGIFQARIYIGDRRYLSKSLKTSILTEAQTLARKFLYETEYKQQEGLPLNSRTFSDVLNEYLKFREQQYEQSLKSGAKPERNQTVSIHMLRQIRRVSKFWHEYCGKLPILKVDNSTLIDYIAWRKDYYHRKSPDKIPRNAKPNPTDSTLLWETTLAKTVLRWAHDRGYRGNTQLPTWHYKKQNRIVRPTFTPLEYKRVYERMRAWIQETDDAEYKYTRELLRDYVLILANSGMRVGEANNLKESDIEQFVDERGRKNYMLQVKGKTGSRIVIPRTGTVAYIERVLARNAVRKAETAPRTTRSPKRKQDSKQGWFFSMYDGNRVVTLIDQFQTVLESIGLLANRHGERYTLYSLRHFYAVNRLRKGVPVFDVARNMGTSVQIIEQYYGKDANTLAVAASLGR